MRQGRPAPSTTYTVALALLDADCSQPASSDRPVRDPRNSSEGSNSTRGRSWTCGTRAVREHPGLPSGPRSNRRQRRPAAPRGRPPGRCRETNAPSSQGIRLQRERQGELERLLVRMDHPIRHGSASRRQKLAVLRLEAPRAVHPLVAGGTERRADYPGAHPVAKPSGYLVLVQTDSCSQCVIGRPNERRAQPGRRPARSSGLPAWIHRPGPRLDGS